MTRNAALLIALFIGACDSSTPTQTQLGSDYAQANAAPEKLGDLTNSAADIGGMRGGITYAAYDAQRDKATLDTFRGFGCLDRLCEDHQAGWEWAYDNGARTAADCGGDNWSFFEGCVAFTRANAD